MKTIIMPMLILILVSGCATKNQYFLSNPVSDKAWGLDTEHLLYDTDGLRLYANLVKIDTKIDGGYRTDKETWKISVVNTNTDGMCVEAAGITDKFKITYYQPTPLMIPANTHDVLWVMEQEQSHPEILGFEFYKDSFFAIAMKDC